MALTGNPWTLLLLVNFVRLALVQGGIVDQVYDQCSRETSSRLPLECIGFPKTISDCISRRNCDMIAMLTVVPSKDGNHFYDRFNITLIGVHLLDASKHEMSFILDAAFKPTYHPGEGTYYNCSWTQRDQNIETMVKSPGQLVESIGTGIIDQDLLICTWLLDRNSDSWPTDHEGRKIDLVTRKAEIILFKDGQRSQLLDTRLPIYKSRYLYKDCDHPDVKYCLASPFCVKPHYECHEILTVSQSTESTKLTKRPLPSASKPDSDLLEFNLYSFDYVTNDSFYDVTLYTGESAPSFQVICGKHTIEAYFVFPNGTQELSTSTLTSSFPHSDSTFDGLRCNWTMPKKFTSYGTNFDTQTIKYFVKLRHSPNVYVDSAPVALPGFHIDTSLYKQCSHENPERLCFGLDPSDPIRDCLVTKDCKAFAVFSLTSDETSPSSRSSPFTEPQLTLDLYATREFISSSPSSPINMSLTLSADNNNLIGDNNIYKCLYHADGQKSSSIETPNKRARNGQVTIEHDWIRCQWIWWPNGTNWPTNNKSETIDLVNRRPILQFTVNGVKKYLPRKNLPVYKLRYLYSRCTNGASLDGSTSARTNLCLESEPGCLKSYDCSTIIHMREHLGREAIDVQVLLTRAFDKLELVYIDPEDNSIKIECSSEEKVSIDVDKLAREWYKTKKMDTYQPIDNQFIKYPDSHSFKMGFSRCNWLQEKQHSIGLMQVDSEINRYNVRLSVINDEGLIAGYSWDKVGLVGYKAKDKQSDSPSSTTSSLSTSGTTNLWLSLAFTCLYYYCFLSHDHQNR